MRLTTDEAADVIITKLKEKFKDDITIHYYKSYTSNSIYLKLDYGASSSIRISDHKKPDNEYHYKYELRTDMNHNYHSTEGNVYIMRFAGKNVDNLIGTIIYNRDKRTSYKSNIYKKEVKKRKKYMESKAKKFYKNCIEITNY